VAKQLDLVKSHHFKVVMQLLLTQVELVALVVRVALQEYLEFIIMEQSVLRLNSEDHSSHPSCYHLFDHSFRPMLE